MATHVVALFDDRAHAEQAVHDLIEGNIPKDRISLIGAHGEETVKKMEGGAALVAEGAAAGLTTGAVVGGVLGLLAGAGIGFIPAGIAIAGPLSGLLAGGAAGAATGGILGGLVGLGIPSNLADVYSQGIEKGGAVVAVEARDQDVEVVEEILDRDGAIDVHERATRPIDESPVARETDRTRTRVARYVRQEPSQNQPNIPDGRAEVNAEDQFEPYHDLFRADFSARNLENDSYAEHEPAYRFGFEAAKRDIFDGHDWSTAEAQLHDEWENARPGTWERYRHAIMTGWNRSHAQLTNGDAEAE